MTYLQAYTHAYEVYGKDWKMCENKARLALNLATTDKEKANAYFMLEKAVDNLGNPGEAIKYAMKALDLYRELQEEKLASDVQMDVAMLFRRCNAIESSLHIYRSVLKQKQELNDTEYVAGTMRNMAIIFREINQYDSAVHYNTEALKLYKSLDMPGKQSRVLNELGLTLHGLEQYNEAVQYYFDALLADDSEQRRAKTYNNAGMSLMRSGDYEKAKRYLMVSVSMKDELFTEASRMRTFNNLAEVYEHEGDLDSARFYIAKSYALTDTINEEILETHEIYQRLFEDDAQRLAESSKAVMKYAKELELKEIENKQLFDYYQLQTSLYEIRQEELKEKQRQERLVWIIVLCGAGLVTLMIILKMVSTYRQKKATKRDLLKTIKRGFND